MRNLVITLSRFLALFAAAVSQGVAEEGVKIIRETGAGFPFVITGDKAVFDLASGEIKVFGKDVRVDSGSDYLYLVQEATLQADGTCRIIPRKPEWFPKNRPRKPATRQTDNPSRPGEPAPVHPSHL